MKILFHIEEPAAKGSEELVSLRIGSHHAGYAVTDRNGEKLRRLSYCYFEEWDAAVEKHLLQAKLDSKLIIGFDYPDAILVEDNAGIENEKLLKQFTGDPGSDVTVLSDHFRKDHLKIVYQVPSLVHEWLMEHFPGSICRHDYSITLETEEQGDYPAAIHADFRTRDFTAVVWKHGKLVQAGSFPYEKPADVLFYLLRICQSFSLSQSTTHILLSGLIDRQSILFTELYQYFIPVDFSPAGWNNSASYPAHFFAGFQKLAACAS